MSFEQLPNEIFLDLFDYFDGTDLLCAFYGLNTRLNFLLYHQFRSYRFRFGSVSKRHFDVICQQHFPFIANQVTALQLSDNSQTPGEINRFISYIPSFRPFIHLKSLALFDFHSHEILLELLDQCQHLSWLTHLKLYSYSFSHFSVDCQLILNKIWSLPKLTNCYFDININNNQDLCIPTIISTSLECVTLYCNNLQWSQLHRLLEYTPRLKRLSTSMSDPINDHYIAYSYPTLISLTICIFSSFVLSKMIVLFQNTPYLRHLDVYTWSQLTDGHQWEQIVRNHLPKLKTLRLKMEKAFSHGENIQEEAHNLLDSFRSSFWIDEYQWFVRCITWNSTIYLETLSAASDYFKGRLPDSWQSTDPHDNQQEMCQNITSIYSGFFDKPISSNIWLPNIEYLCTNLPINDQFWSIVPSLDKLNSLIVLSHADPFQSQLQTLLDRAPHLHTFRISQDASLPLQMSLFKYTNASVREIDLYDYNHDFDEEECLALSSSPLGVQCEVLSIRVTNRKSIIHFDKNILNLRSLTVKCADDKYHKQAGLTEHNDELVQWLKSHLSPLYMIVRNSGNAYVLIWM